jgi:hypothetical protein
MGATSYRVLSGVVAAMVVVTALTITRSISKEPVADLAV